MASVSIIAGRAGSGKTLRFFRQIVKAIRTDPLGPPIYWIVPRQSTFSIERWLTCGSGLDAVTRCRVVSFEQLAETVLQEHPGPARVVVSPLGRLAVMGHLLRANAGQLRYFRDSASQPGLAKEVIGTLDEFSRNGAMTQDEDGKDALERATEQLASGSELHSKLSDLILLRDAYRALMGPDRFDKDARMDHVLRKVGETRAFAGARFYIDGFIDFLDFERRMIASLCETADHSRGSVEIAFSLPADYAGLDRLEHVPRESSVFHRIEAAHLALRERLRERKLPVQVVRLVDPLRTKDAELLALERAFSADGPPATGVEASAETGAVECVVAPDHGTELDFVARRIRELTCDPNGPKYRCREIVVLARSLEPYARDLHHRFLTHGIPHFFDRRHDATSHPLPRAVRAIVAMASSTWSTHEMVSLCRSGLVRGCDLELAARVDHWAMEKGISGEAWRTSVPRTGEDIEAVRAALVLALGPWIEMMQRATDTPLRGIVGELLQTIERLGIRQTLESRVEAARASDDAEEFCEDERIWTAFTSFLEELVDLLGDQPIRAKDLHSIITAVFESLDLGSVPSTVDQVLIGDAERTRVVNARAVFVIGLSEGQFPLPQTDLSLLSPPQRSALRSVGAGVDEGADRRQLDERLIVYFAVTRASERLILSRPATDPRGQPLGPSPFWDRAVSVVGTDRVREARSADDFRGVATPQQLVQCVLRNARTGRIEGSAVLRAMYDTVRLAEATTELGRLRDRVWASLRPPALRLRLPEDLTRALFPVPYEMRVDELERFIHCPFQRFVRDVLGVTEVSPPRVDGGRLSGILRNVFHQFTSSLLAQQEQSDWSTLDEQTATARVQDLVKQAIAAEVRKLSFDGSADRSKLAPKDREVLRSIEGGLQDLVAAHREASHRTAFRPHQSRVSSHNADLLKPLSITRNGKELLRLTASIDRVDRTGTDTVIAWDYRLRECKTTLPLMYHQVNLKLPVLLLLLRQQERDAAAALTLPLRAAPQSFASIDEWLKAPLVNSPEFRLRRRRGIGLIRENVVKAIDTGLSDHTRTSPLIRASLNKDGSVSGKSADVLDGVVFDALLDHIFRGLQTVAAAVVEGVADISPYKFGTTSACARCDYQSACRFNPREGGTYVHLTPRAPRDIKTLLRPASPPAPPEDP